MVKVLAGGMVTFIVGYSAPYTTPCISPSTGKESTGEGRALRARPSVVESVVVYGEMYGVIYGAICPTIYGTMAPIQSSTTSSV